jgi:hypothetical protein
MNKVAIICKLHEMTDHYQLGAGSWPASQEFLPAFYKMVRELGLEEDVPDSPGTTRSTALGNELNLDMVMAFVGAWDMWEMPYILESHGYLEESEAEELYIGLDNGLPPDAKRKLRWYVLRAYLKFCNRSSRLN